MSSEEDRRRARELADEARALASRKQYELARRRYEASLDLHEDEQVRADYQRLLSALGPM